MRSSQTTNTTYQDLRKEQSRTLKELLDRIQTQSIVYKNVSAWVSEERTWYPFRYWVNPSIGGFAQTHIFKEEYKKFSDELYKRLSECVELVRGKADPNTKSCSGRSIMHYLAAALSKSGKHPHRREFYINTLKELKNEYGADINLRSGFLFPTYPLRDFLDGVQNSFPNSTSKSDMFVLLELGANPLIKDSRRHALTHFIKNNEELIEKLDKIRNENLNQTQPQKRC